MLISYLWCGEWLKKVEYSQLMEESRGPAIFRDQRVLEQDSSIMGRIYAAMTSSVASDVAFCATTSFSTHIYLSIPAID